uniref:Putative serine/threonine-protein kinase SgK494-like protein n=2 Tax=Callorhinchus milii TaxID=7868 RepID=V9L739_CALMI
MLWSTHGPFAEGKLRVFAAELGSALGFLHDFGVIHRDVKMENILINDKGHLKLTDFGLSHRLRRGERAYTICGTMQYMAPEVLSGGPYNHSSDWWSLGILLHVLATNRFPVEPETDHSAMLVSVQMADLTPPATVSHSLALLLAELLCKNPLRRLRLLDHFAHQHFFQGLSFDPDLLQKLPMDSPLSAEKLTALPDPFRDFDGDFLGEERLTLPLAG